MPHTIPRESGELSVPQISAARRRAITAALLLGTFLASIEVTVVATAMPSIVEQIGGLALYPWVFSAYLLTQTVTIPLYGRLADLHGRRPVYVGGVALFLLGSVLAGMAPSMPALVAARAVQGLGAGCVIPLTMTIFGDLYEVSTRTKLQGLFSLVWGFSSVAGPLAGGTIVMHLSWHWVFLLNVPFGLLSAVAVAWLLKERPLGRRRPLDLGGAFTLSAATLLLLVALLPADQRPLAAGPFLWLAGAVLCALAFLGLERRHPEPLVPLDLFRDRVQVAANAAGVLQGVVLFGVSSYLPLYIQAVRGKTPIEAGALLIPLSLGWTVATFVGGRVVRRVGFQLLVRVGSTLIAVGAGLGYLGIVLDLLWVGVLGLVSYGLGMGLCVSSFVVSVQERVPPARRGIATALTQFSRSIGGAVGVAVLGVVLTTAVGTELHAVTSAGADPALVGLLDQGLRTVFMLMVGAATGAALVALALFPRVAEGMSSATEETTASS
jgi:EmrB/QacA subfamily drug resistance transporter